MPLKIQLSKNEVFVCVCIFALALVSKVYADRRKQAIHRDADIFWAAVYWRYFD